MKNFKSFIFASFHIFLYIHVSCLFHLFVFTFVFSVIFYLFLYILSMLVYLFVCLFGWLVGWLVGLLCLWHINFCRLFNAKSIFIPINTSISIQFSVSTQFN